MDIKTFKILKLNIEANMLRIEQLLNTEGIEKQFKEDKWYSINGDNVELRQRLKLLRKDTLKMERGLTVLCGD